MRVKIIQAGGYGRGEEHWDRGAEVNFDEALARKLCHYRIAVSLGEHVAAEVVAAAVEPEPEPEVEEAPTEPEAEPEVVAQVVRPRGRPPKGR